MNLSKVKQLNLPKSPGVYQFLNKNGEIIYIGKAANLKSRILSYWQKSTTHSLAKYSMLKQVEKINWLETNSEIEALLLEANLIKKHQPQYNIALRDDKRYVYIKISSEEDWPRVFMTRKLEKSGKYFGPFVSAEAVRQTLKAIRKIWPYRSCSRLPKKACLYYRINKCPGMCENLITKQEYKRIIRQITLFLQGKKKQVIKEIEKEISKGVNIDYLKYQLANLNKVLEHTNILSLVEKYATDVVEVAKILGLPRVPQRIEGYDISNLPVDLSADQAGKVGILDRQAAVGSMVVFTEGEPDKSEYRKFKIKIDQGKLNDVRMLCEVLKRRFGRVKKVKGSGSLKFRGLVSDRTIWPVPDLIIIDGGKAQLNAAIRIVKNVGLDLPVIAIAKGKGLRSAQAPDKLFFPGEKKPLELSLSSPALHLLKRVRDEAHRFAVSYHRQLRKKSVLQ